MNTNSASKKAISMVCLIAGIILLAVSLIQDISGKRSWLERSGADHWCNRHFTGNVFIPDIKHHRSIVNFIFVFPLLFTFVSNSYYSIMPWCVLFLYRLEWNQDDRICRIYKL